MPKGKISSSRSRPILTLGLCYVGLPAQGFQSQILLIEILNFREKLIEKDRNFQTSCGHDVHNVGRDHGAAENLPDRQLSIIFQT